MRIFLTIVFLFTSFCIHGQSIKLSSKAEIYVVTCGPYIGELYSAFGHSAIRVTDPVNRIDLIYNYGIFDFDQPNFYLNFAKGFLYYKLAVQDYENFKYTYIYYNRFIHEQRLNLSVDQKQRVFDFLQWNAQPENQYYRYDYFYDNCATRVRDAFVKALGEEVVFNLDYVDGGLTIRELTDLYLQPNYPWGDLGIDLCLGLPMDKTATSWMYMYLPDYIEQGFASAEVIKGSQKEPLVIENIVTFASTPSESDLPLAFTPVFLFWFFFVIILVTSIWQWLRKKRGKYLDVFLFVLTGLLGWFLLLLWLATDHQAAARNMNILWAFPLNIPVAFWLLKKDPPKWAFTFYGFFTVLLLLLVVFWSLLPQHLHYSLIPICLALTVRSAKIWVIDRKKIYF